MTGTAVNARRELWQIFKLPVVPIPTNKPCIRTVPPDFIYANEDAKFAAIVQEIQRLHARGQPILVGTRSIKVSERLSSLLDTLGLKHETLNAKYHAEEANIVARAGGRGCITVATNMAGRGTDIKLARGVAELGGLCVHRHRTPRVPPRRPASSSAAPHARVTPAVPRRSCPWRTNSSHATPPSSCPWHASWPAKPPSPCATHTSVSSSTAPRPRPNAPPSPNAKASCPPTIGSMSPSASPAQNNVRALSEQLYRGTLARFGRLLCRSPATVPEHPCAPPFRSPPRGLLASFHSVLSAVPPTPATCPHPAKPAYYPSAKTNAPPLHTKSARCH